MLIFLIGQKNMANLVEDRVDGGFNVIGDIPSIHGNTGQPSSCQPSTVEPITTFPMIWEFFVWQSIVIQHGLTTLHSLVAYSFVRISLKVLCAKKLHSARVKSQCYYLEPIIDRAFVSSRKHNRIK
jgi:hypothetical protein